MALGNYRVCVTMIFLSLVQKNSFNKFLLKNILNFQNLALALFAYIVLAWRPWCFLRACLPHPVSRFYDHFSSRPTLSQFWLFKIRRTTFPNCTNLSIGGFQSCKVAKAPVGKCTPSFSTPRGWFNVQEFMDQTSFFWRDQELLLERRRGHTRPSILQI